MSRPDAGRRTMPEQLADSASWQLAGEAARSLAARTLVALETREVVERLADRYANSPAASRAGHLFEVMHALSFNQSAAASGSAVRAVVTEWAGAPTAPADLQLMRGGVLLGQAQAKVYGNVVGAAHELSADRYAGMQRLVPGDQADALQSLLDRRLRLNPDGLHIDRFRDARANVTAALRHDELASSPIDYDDVQRASADPNAWLAGQVRQAAAKQVLTGAGTAGAVGAVVGALADAAGSAARWRAGEMTGTEAAISAAGSAASCGARAAASAGLAETLKIGVDAGTLHPALGAGSAPYAIASATVDVARAGFDLATGAIGPGEFAARSAEATTRASISWAFTALGQTVIPVPVVGALVGGVVGTLVGTTCVKGVQTALVAARADHAAADRLAALELELLTAVTLTEELSELTRQAGQSCGAYVAEVVMPQLDHARRQLLLDDDDAVLEQFARVVASFGSTPLFTTMVEFDLWMAGNEPLVLDGNWRRPGG